MDPVTTACAISPIASWKIHLSNNTTVACLNALCDLNNSHLIKMLQEHVQGNYLAISFVTWDITTHDHLLWERTYLDSTEPSKQNQIDIIQQSHTEVDIETSGYSISESCDRGYEVS